MDVKTIKVSETQDYKIKQLIDLAGFNTVMNGRNITLKDKKNPNADNYADLTFRTFYEAAKAIESYLSNSYRFVL